MLDTIALWIIFISAPVVFIFLFFFTAPYGRHYRAGWGPAIKARAAWMLMEAPALLVIGLTVLLSGRNASPLAILLLGLWRSTTSTAHAFSLSSWGKATSASL